ncbi:hypothetical protein VNO77_19337 [Canavalia gladiata]|uniref:Uncharacterized protein n=1 Tax=Canavalia gladiata TaxID=3824 RepID=A0AAN9LQS0_CANGL
MIISRQMDLIANLPTIDVAELNASIGILTSLFCKSPYSSDQNTCVRLSVHHLEVPESGHVKVIREECWLDVSKFVGMTVDKSGLNSYQAVRLETTQSGSWSPNSAFKAQDPVLHEP